jgi:hypothetical protein
MPTRTCGFCTDGELQQTKTQALRGGGREGTWTCASCGNSVKLLDPGGRALFTIVTVLITAAVPWAALTSKVKDESERPLIVLLMAALAAALIGLLVVDTRRQRRHPPRS